MAVRWPWPSTSPEREDTILMKNRLSYDCRKKTRTGVEHEPNVGSRFGRGSCSSKTACNGRRLPRYPREPSADSTRTRAKTVVRCMTVRAPRWSASCAVFSPRSTRPISRASDWLSRKRSARSRREAAKRPRAEIQDAEAAEPSLRDRGLRDFRETVAEVEGLGRATAEAKRAAHATYEAMPAEPEPHYFEPEPAPEPTQITEPPPIEEPPPRLPPAIRRKPRRPQLMMMKTDTRGARSDLTGVPSSCLCCCWCWPGSPVRHTGSVKRSHRWRRASVRSRRSPRTRASRQPARRSPTVSGSPARAASDTATAPAAAVAQESCSTMNNTNDPQGKRYVGSAIWRTGRCRRGRASRPKRGRADIEIPERNLRMTWSSAARPTRHCRRARPSRSFTLPADFPEAASARARGADEAERTGARRSARRSRRESDQRLFPGGAFRCRCDLHATCTCSRNATGSTFPSFTRAGSGRSWRWKRAPPTAPAFEEAFRAWGQ